MKSVLTAMTYLVGIYVSTVSSSTPRSVFTNKTFDEFAAVSANSTKSENIIFVLMVSKILITCQLHTRPAVWFSLRAPKHDFHCVHLNMLCVNLRLLTWDFLRSFWARPLCSFYFAVDLWPFMFASSIKFAVEEEQQTTMDWLNHWRFVLLHALPCCFFYQHDFCTIACFRTHVVCNIAISHCPSARRQQPVPTVSD